MAPTRIFVVELIVEELQMFAQEPPSRDRPAETPEPPTEETPQSEEPPTSCPERCIRFQLANIARCEVCEKDFGSQLDVENSKLGESCMFTLNEADLGEDHPLSFELSALEKQKDGRKKLLGKWEQPANEIFTKLAKSYDELNGRKRSETSILTVLSDDSISRKSVPVSETIKSLYPLQDDNEVVQGCVIVALRISCLGSRITQKVMFGGKEQQAGITCFKATDQENKEQFMKCVAFDEVAHPHPVLCGDCEKASVQSLPRTPPASVSSREEVCSPYDEYTAEMNGNAITIRVEKSSEIKVMLDGEQDGGCTKGCWTSLALPEGVYALEERYVQQQANACKLPIIRGNLKYPAQQWPTNFQLCKAKRPICAEDFRKRPDPTRNVCMQTRDPEEVTRLPHGIEICRQGWSDPNVDVFVLKLGKDKTSRGEGSRNQIELELRTPKGPMVERRPKETRGVQVIEAEFEDLKKPTQAVVETGGKKKPKKGAASGKKGKKK